MNKVKAWFSNLGLMLKPYWQYGKLYCIINAVWDCLYSPVTTMLYVYLMEIILNQLSEGHSFSVIFSTIMIFFLISISVHTLSEVLYAFYFEPTKRKLNQKLTEMSV